MNARSTPPRIRSAHRSDKIADVVSSTRSALAFPALPAPIQTEPSAAPSNDCCQPLRCEPQNPNLARDVTARPRRSDQHFASEGADHAENVREQEADAEAPESRLAKRRENATNRPGRKTEGLRCSTWNANQLTEHRPIRSMLSTGTEFPIGTAPLTHRCISCYKVTGTTLAIWESERRRALILRNWRGMDCAAADATMRLPMFTTRVSSGAIIGLGLQKNSGLNWKTVREMLLAWIAAQRQTAS